MMEHNAADDTDIEFSCHICCQETQHGFGFREDERIIDLKCRQCGWESEVDIDDERVDEDFKKALAASLLESVLSMLKRKPEAGGPVVDHTWSKHDAKVRKMAREYVDNITADYGEATQ